MSSTRFIRIVTACAVSAAPLLPAQETQQKEGQVQIPIQTYTNLIDKARDAARPAPVGYALGSAQVRATVKGSDTRTTATVHVELSIKVLEDQWVLVPVLPAGTPVQKVSVAGQPVQLVAAPSGLAWSTRKAGAYTMTLDYAVDAVRSEAGYVLALPLPRAAATRLTATLPGSGLDVAVIPAAGTRVRPSGSNTRVEATIPTSDGVQLSWRLPAREGHSMSRSRYKGQLVGEAVSWSAELGVEIYGDRTVTLPLLPASTTLTNLRVDGREGPIFTENGRFTTRVKGAGVHKVTLGFETPVIRKDGPPRVELDLPRVPVSRFELILPGKKEVTVTPAANVRLRTQGASTVATVHVPMTGRVALAWSEAVPEDVRAEVRANASLYHAVHAEEGVLYVHGMILYEVTRGETNVIELDVPPGVQVDRVSATSGAVTDWRIVKGAGAARKVSVFLDRQLRGQLLFDVFYDRSIGTKDKDKAEAEALDVPLLRVGSAERQRGMVALLSSSDLTLDPVDEGGATRVGENQLPAFVREAVSLTVAHTFKYVETSPKLSVRASVPERVQGKFDARVDTLISLGEVTVTGSASIEVDVKSGRIMDLQLRLPEGVNLLSLAAPSLRSRKARADDDRIIDVEFTQDMEGQFRLDLNYERILAEGEAQVQVPTVAVLGAEVEQGRVAVEALSAVEVQPSSVSQLTSLDVSELPQHLVLRTTNPILLAYKYVRADPPPELILKVTHHRVVGVQEAAIDQADYRTLLTRDGLSVTTARFVVRNSRKQFLRVRLPEHSEVWSAFVDGKPEKPALAGEDGQADERNVLIKIINSTRGFPVQLVYATHGPRIGGLGTARGTLARPDILVTQSRWDVYLPDDMAYGEATTNMDLVAQRVPVSGSAMQAELAAADKSVATQAVQPLRISVPTSGIHFAFEKLYANQSDAEAWFAIPYASTTGTAVGRGVSLLGVLLFWVGLLFVLKPDPRVERRAALGTAGGGLLVVLVCVGLYNVSPMPAMWLSVLLLAGTGLARVARRGLRAAQPVSPSEVERGSKDEG